MNRKDLERLPKKGLLPGYEDGRYERVQTFDSVDLNKPQLEDPARRDNRVSIRISGQDLHELHRVALTQGVTVQSLLSTIIRSWVQEQVVAGDAVKKGSSSISRDRLLK